MREHTPRTDHRPPTTAIESEGRSGRRPTAEVRLRDGADPVIATTSDDSRPGRVYRKIQSMASYGPAMKPSNDMLVFQSPIPVRPPHALQG